MTDPLPIRTRLFVKQPLAAGAAVGLDRARAHYLLRVLRLGAGDGIGLFNGRDGDWAARIDGFGKNWCSLAVVGRRRPQEASPDLTLLFAPIKRARIDFLVEKATELGCRAIQPVITRRTAVARVNLDRLRANAMEAAEQTERLDLPDIREPVTLDRLLDDWHADRPILAAIEAGPAAPIAEALRDRSSPSDAASPGMAVLIGPEGGFAPDERARLHAHAAVLSVGLGPRLLRADTAALAALAIVQALAGDWVRRPPDRQGDRDRWAWPNEERTGPADWPSQT